MIEKYYYTNEKGEEVFRKVKYYSDSKYLYNNNFEKTHEYKVDNQWVTNDEDGLDEQEVMLYKNPKLHSGELFLVACEEEVNFLSERGFIATTFWTHSMRFKDLAPKISEFFSGYNRIYIPNTLIEMLEYGTDRNPTYNDNLGKNFLEELSKICPEIIILDIYEITGDIVVESKGCIFPTITAGLNKKNCNTNDKKAIWNELMSMAYKYKKTELESKPYEQESLNLLEIQILEEYRKLAKERKNIPINEKLKSYTLLAPKSEEDNGDCSLYIETNGIVKIYNNTLKKITDLINILGFDMDQAFSLINEENLEKIYDKDILPTVIELKEKVCELDRFTKRIYEL